MYFTRILLTIVFILSASTALAKKPDKILVCHVGNELGSMDETYQDNPDCTIPPEWVGDPADYICPDAGKVDLILVSKKAKHIDNPDHSFDDGTYLWEDYSPEDGVGDDPADFEEGDVSGIDRGCELEELLSCPCFTVADLREVGDGRTGGCGVDPNGTGGGFISGLDSSWVDAGSPSCSTVDCAIYRELATVTAQGGNNRCVFNLAPDEPSQLVIQTTPDQFIACRDMIADEIANRPISGCGWH